MFGLQELFDEQIKKQSQPNSLGVRILESELERIGLNLTNEQCADLEAQFQNLGKNSISIVFDFNEKQLQEAGVSSEEELKQKLEAILNKFGESIEKFAGKLEGTMEDLVLRVIDKMASSVKTLLAQRMKDMIEDQNAVYHGFAEDIQRVWGKPLQLLQGLIVISDEAAQGYLTRSDSYSSNNIVQDVLLRINAKANQISKEILTLLRNGFADGAQARWRSLHELAVVSSFISHHGEEVAKRYILHEAVERYKVAVQYNEYYPRLGALEISQGELALMEEAYNKLVDTYGQEYKHDYGWASEALGINRPTFKDIELSVKLDHYRPYYRVASANIHADPIGVLYRLGVFPEEGLLLAGPSSIGLAEPARLTIISLTQITTSILTYSINIDFLVVCKVMDEYGKEVEKAFFEVEEEINKQRDA